VTGRFTRAIVRPPGSTFADGITKSGLGPPDIALARAQHARYCETLERLGVSLVRMPPDDAFPDGTFVEDTAILARGDAILTRPGAASRAGEVSSVAAVLGDWFSRPARVAAPGTIDGGDVCEAGGHFFIGRSDRTNDAGAAHVAAWLRERGCSATLIDIRSMAALLHLKSGLAWLGERRLLATEELVGHPELGAWDLLRVPRGEEYAANCLRVNEALVIAEGFPATAAALRAEGYDVIELDLSEFRKMDGGPSCLSLRW
jgi:dimethylargininase